MFNDEGLGAAMGQHYTEKKADEAKASVAELTRRVDFLERHLIDLQAHVININNMLMGRKQ